jgi:hypothetical protein
MNSGRAKKLLTLFALAIASLTLAGCSSSSFRVSYAGEIDRCSDSRVLYLDELGDEFDCQGLTYDGPLTRGEKRETLRLASRLASDGSLSAEDKKLVNEFAANPSALARTSFVPITIFVAGGKVQVLGRARDASFHIAEINPSNSDVTTFALSPKSITGLATAGKTAWFYSSEIWSPRTPVWQTDLTAPERARRLTVFRSDKQSASVGAIASDGDSLWIALTVVDKNGAGMARVERYDLRSRVVTAAVDLPSESGVREISIGAGAVWAEGAHRWKLDLEATHAKQVDSTLSVGPIRVDADAIWALGRSDPTSLQLSRIDPANGKVLTSIPVDGDIAEFEVGGGAVWLLHQAGELERFDPASSRLESIAKLDLETPASVYSSDGAASRSLAVTSRAAWVILNSSGQVARIDAATGKVKILQLSVE